MGNIYQFPETVRSRTRNKNWREKAGLTAAALVAGIGGTLLVQKATESKPDRQLQAEFRGDLRQVDAKIGAMLLSELAKIHQLPSVSDPDALYLETPRGSIEASMDVVDGRWDAKTTNGVTIQLDRPDFQSLRGNGATDYLYIARDDGHWRASGNLVFDPEKGQVVSVDARDNDPNLTNSQLLAQKAENMAQAIVDSAQPQP
jgi:hypothetical protein